MPKTIYPGSVISSVEKPIHSDISGLPVIQVSEALTGDLIAVSVRKTVIRPMAALSGKWVLMDKLTTTLLNHFFAQRKTSLRTNKFFYICFSTLVLLHVSIFIIQ